MPDHLVLPYKKVFGVPLQKSFVKNQDGTLLVRGFFTSDRVDEIGDIITRAATEAALPKYRTWGNIRLMHQPVPVGRVTKIGTEDGLEWNEVEIKVIDPQAIFMVEQGLLLALSVGILINFEDIEDSEGGGWIINAYQLAEISLVDHPANYDAALKNIPVRGDLRVLAREYGLDVVVRGLQVLKELPMNKDVEETPVEETPGAAEELPVADETKSPPCLQEGESIEDCVNRKVPEIMEENPEMEQDQAVAMAQEMCGKPCSEDAPADEPETSEDGTISPDVAETTPADTPETQDQATERLTASVDALVAAITEISEQFNAILDRMTELLNSLETPEAEAPLAEEQAVGDGDKDLPSDEDEEQPGPAVNRIGAVQETGILEAKNINSEEPPPSDLKSALRKHFNR